MLPVAVACSFSDGVVIRYDIMYFPTFGCMGDVKFSYHGTYRLTDGHGVVY